MTAKNGFLRTHIYEKRRPFFERMCGKNLKFKIFEFVGFNSELIVLNSGLVVKRKSALNFSKNEKLFFIFIFDTF